MRRALLVIGAVAVVAAIAIGLTQAGSNEKPVNSAPSAAEVAKAFRGSPAPLAALHGQRNRLLGGGVSALKTQIKSLRGHPIVINKWGSWCGPCKFEFPFLQQLSVRYGRRVAFIGIDTEDNNGDARRFLSRFPVSYPSYSDPDGKLADSVRASRFNPSTLFLDRRGELNFQHQGAYANQKDFEDDIRRYALGS
jgi:cytochrome c biogenesis protein CcmG, thiol:disulfide interchange protein DsbE